MHDTCPFQLILLDWITLTTCSEKHDPHYTDFSIPLSFPFSYVQAFSLTLWKRMFLNVQIPAWRVSERLCNFMIRVILLFSRNQV